VKSDKINLADSSTTNSLIAKSSILDQIDKATVSMYTRYNMKELQLVIIRNNMLN